jgi:hypothetical protein
VCAATIVTGPGPTAIQYLPGRGVEIRAVTVGKRR